MKLDGGKGIGLQWAGLHDGAWTYKNAGSWQSIAQFGDQTWGPLLLGSGQVGVDCSLGSAFPMFNVLGACLQRCAEFCLFATLGGHDPRKWKENFYIISTCLCGEVLHMRRMYNVGRNGSSIPCPVQYFQMPEQSQV